MHDLVANENAEDGEDHQHNKAHKQHATTGGEVVLGLF